MHQDNIGISQTRCNMKSKYVIKEESAQRINDCVAFEVKSYLTSIGVENFKIEPHVAIHKGYCFINAIRIVLNDVSEQKTTLIRDFIEKYTNGEASATQLSRIEVNSYFSENMIENAWGWMKSKFNSEFLDLSSDLNIATEQVRSKDGEFKAFSFTRSIIECLNGRKYQGFWSEEKSTASTGQMGLFF